MGRVTVKRCRPGAARPRPLFRLRTFPRCTCHVRQVPSLSVSLTWGWKDLL